MRDTHHSSRDPDTGKFTFKGNAVKHRKGEPFLVDCNVTGSDVGTPTDPKFSLKHLWEYTLIPTVELLVAPGGPCEGATVIFQEDNAGPHNCRVYRGFLTDAFTERGWYIRLQAPQGMHTWSAVGPYLSRNSYPYTSTPPPTPIPTQDHTPMSWTCQSSR